MKRFILTGAPGAGKTAILRRLSLAGHSIVEEAAADIITLLQAQGIAEPWTHPVFIDAVVNLQWHRQLESKHGEVQFHDRSVFCTATLASNLQHPPSITLQRELDRIHSGQIFQHKVFLIRNLGFIPSSAAHRVTLEQALLAERMLEDTYRGFGFDLIHIQPDTISRRAAAIEAHIHA